MNIDKMKVPEEIRVALSDTDKEEIYKLNSQGLSLRRIAQEIGCSKKTVWNILNPTKYKEALAKKKEQEAWKKYYNTEKNTKYAKAHRQKKSDFVNKK